MPIHPTSTPLGADAGRVVPSEFAAAEGTHTLCLGSDRLQLAVVRPGQTIGWEQSIDGTGFSRVDFALFVEMPLGRMPLHSLAGPFALADEQTLLLDVDEIPQTITFLTADFNDIANATAEEVVLIIARTLLGVIQAQTEEGDRFSLRTSTLFGKEAILSVSGGTAAAALGLQDLVWRYRFLIDGIVVADVLTRPGDARRLNVGAPIVPFAPQPAVYRHEVLLDVKGGVPDPTDSLSLQLPGVHVDAGEFLSQTGPYLANQDPAPEETSVRVGRVRYVDCCSNTSNPNIPTIVITADVGGVVETVFTAGAFVAPWDGPESSVSTITVRQVRVCADRTIDLPGATRVEWSVSFATTGFVPESLNETYGWTTEDLDPPGIEKVFPINCIKWRVCFDEPVSDATCVVENFAVELVTLPSILPVFVACTRFDANCVDLDLDVAASFGETYELIVLGAEDTNGNESGELRFQFLGYTPEWLRPRRLCWPDLVAPRRFELSPGGTLRKVVEALDDLHKLTLYDLDDVAFRQNSPDLMPANRLPEALSILGGSPFGIPTTEAQDRTLLNGVLHEFYSRAGTKLVLEDTILFFVRVVAEVFRPYKDAFTLDESLLDGPDLLMGSEESIPLQFGIEVFVELTEKQRAEITRIALTGKAHVEIFIGIVEPNPPAAEIFTLDLSLLDGLDVLG